MNLQFKEIFETKDLDACWAAIKAAKSFTLLGHKDPDRDAAFSCLAMAEVLKLLGKTNVQIIFPNKPYFKVQTTAAKVLHGKHNFVADLTIVFDSSTKDRIYFPAEFEKSTVINIDHHLGNSINGQYNFVDINACSAAEVLARLVFAWDEKIFTAELAQLLMIGILDDSIVFKTQQSGYTALSSALKLIEHGADFIKAKTIVAGYKTPETVRIWAYLMSCGELTGDGRLFVIKVSQIDLKKLNFDIDALEGLVNFVSNVINTDVVALIRETETEIKVSMRSKKTDVREIAAKFGGGGHKLAAGFARKEPLDEVVSQLIKSFKL